jgi:hypothetical protein
MNEDGLISCSFIVYLRDDTNVHIVFMSPLALFAQIKLKVCDIKKLYNLAFVH